MPLFANNVQYGPNAQQRLDVYKPLTGSNLPAVVMVHGGGWDAGSKAGIATFAAALSARGLVVFDIDYQLDPARPWLAQPADVVRAFVWARTRAATYSADPARFGLFGTSAGAHLALLAAFHGLRAYLPMPKAAAAWSTPADLAAILALQGFDHAAAPYDASANEQGYPSNKIQEFMGWAHLSGCYPSPEPSQPMIDDCTPDCSARYADVSPYALVAGDAPPTFLAHYTDDQVIPVTQTQDLAARLVELGVEVVTQIKPGITAPYHDMANDPLVPTQTSDFFVARL